MGIYYSSGRQLFDDGDTQIVHYWWLFLLGIALLEHDRWYAIVSSIVLLLMLMAIMEICDGIVGNLFSILIVLLMWPIVMVLLYSLTLWCQYWYWY